MLLKPRSTVGRPGLMTIRRRDARLPTSLGTAVTDAPLALSPTVQICSGRSGERGPIGVRRDPGIRGPTGGPERLERGEGHASSQLRPSRLHSWRPEHGRPVRRRSSLVRGEVGRFLPPVAGGPWPAVSEVGVPKPAVRRPHPPPARIPIDQAPGRGPMTGNSAVGTGAHERSRHSRPADVRGSDRLALQAESNAGNP